MKEIGDGTLFMQRVEVIDVNGRIHDQMIPHLYRDWLHDIEIFLPALRAAQSLDEEIVVQIVAGRGTKLQDSLASVPAEALSSSEKFREFMSSGLSSDLRSEHVSSSILR